MSETIFVMSDKGANAAIEKFGKMIEVFGGIFNSDCPCKLEPVCKEASVGQKYN